MPKMLIAATYTAEGTRGLIKEGGTARRATIQKLVESAGGKMEAFYYAYGDYDVYVIVDLPNATSGLALSLAVNASGAVRLTTIPLIAFVNDSGAGYAWWSGDGDLTALFSDTGFSGLTSPEIRFDPCATTTHLMASIVVGATGLDGLLEAVARDRGTSMRAIAGSVLRADGTAAAGARVHATAAAGGAHLTRVTVASDGSYVLHVPGDVADVDVVAYEPGVGLSPSARAAPRLPALAMVSFKSRPAGPTKG